MNEVYVRCAFLCGAVLALLGLRRRPGQTLCRLLAAVCVAAGVPAGLLFGMTLETLLPWVLLVFAAAFAARQFGRGDEDE